MDTKMSQAAVLKIEEYHFKSERHCEPVGEKIALFEAADKNNLPVLLKGPTGCGKTRFMEYMACRGAISDAFTDDAEMLVAVNELSHSVF
jgi:transcriptional regulator with AAA-type ATPase domain